MYEWHYFPEREPNMIINSIPYYSHTIEEGARVPESGRYLIFRRVTTLSLSILCTE